MAGFIIKRLLQSILTIAGVITALALLAIREEPDATRPAIA